MWAAWRRHWLGFLGVVAFAILAPTSSLVPITSEVVAERRMYLPLAACVTVLLLGVRVTLRACRAAPRSRPAPQRPAS